MKALRSSAASTIACLVRHPCATLAIYDRCQRTESISQATQQKAKALATLSILNHLFAPIHPALVAGAMAQASTH